MNLLHLLAPLATVLQKTEPPLEEIGGIPRNELFPAHPPHDDLPRRPLDEVERDRALRIFRYL